MYAALTFSGLASPYFAIQYYLQSPSIEDA
jgi:hypothetical protein